MKRLNWTATKEETESIDKIAHRAAKLANELTGGDWKMFDFLMDIQACHLNGCPLDLDLLLSFPNFDFSHDVFGIRKHINRNTGKLENCFKPRCAQ